LAALAPHLPQALLLRALGSVLAIQAERWRAWVLRLAPHLPDPQRDLERALAIRDERARAEALIRLAPHLPQALLLRVLERALAIGDKEAQAQVIIALASYLPDKQRAFALQCGLEAALAMNDAKYQARVLATYLPLVLDQPPFLSSIRYTLFDLLLAGKDQHRQDVLAFCATKTLFTPPILSPTTLSAITAHIIEICQEWRWV